MKDQAPPLDGHALANCYEALRDSVVEMGGRGQTMVRGRALMVFKGMAAWMKCVGEVSVPSPSAAPLRHGLKLSGGMEQSLVDIVATMALATALGRTGTLTRAVGTSSPALYRDILFRAHAAT